MIRARLRHFLQTKSWERFIVSLIAINAVILGLETDARLMSEIGPILIALDTAILGVFVVEIAARLLAFGTRFFRDPWSLFDLCASSRSSRRCAASSGASSRRCPAWDRSSRS